MENLSPLEFPISDDNESEDWGDLELYQYKILERAGDLLFNRIGIYFQINLQQKCSISSDYHKK